jgi:hypothetical protein
MKEAWYKSLPWWVNPWSAYLDMKKTKDHWFQEWANIRYAEPKKIRKPKKKGGRK